MSAAGRTHGGARGGGGDAGALGVTPRRVLASEWIKLGSLRSTTLTLAAAVGLMVLVSALVCWVTVEEWGTMTPDRRANLQLDEFVLSGRFFAQLAIGVVGTIAITGEYATGMIRATLAAVPRRLPVLWAKLGLFAGVTLALMVPASFASFLLGSAILSAHWDASLSDPGMLRAVLGNAVALTIVCLLGTALGFLFRSTPAAISVLFALLLAIPMIGQLLPDLARYLPSEAMTAISSASPDETRLDTGPAFALLCGYVAIAVAAGLWTLRSRDA